MKMKIKMTKKQAKWVLILGWSLFSVIYLAALFLCLKQKLWLFVILLLANVPMIITEHRRYIRNLKAKK